MKVKYTQRKDGEGFMVPCGEIYRISCCDCGLVHDFVFISEDGKSIGIAAKRNNRATGQKRRNTVKDWQKRVYDERVELLSKIDKLALFVESGKFKNVDVKSQELLRQQLQHMMSYYAVLSARINEFA